MPPERSSASPATPCAPRPERGAIQAVRAVAPTMLSLNAHALAASPNCTALASCSTCAANDACGWCTAGSSVHGAAARGCATSCARQRSVRPVAPGARADRLRRVRRVVGVRVVHAIAALPRRARRPALRQRRLEQQRQRADQQKEKGCAISVLDYKERCVLEPPAARAARTSTTARRAPTRRPPAACGSPRAHAGGSGACVEANERSPGVWETCNADDAPRTHGCNRTVQTYRTRCPLDAAKPFCANYTRACDCMAATGGGGDGGCVWC